MSQTVSLRVPHRVALGPLLAALLAACLGCGSAPFGLGEGSVAVVDGPLTLRDRADIDALPVGPFRVDGELVIESDSLTNLEGLAGLRDVSRALRIRKSAALGRLRGLEGLRRLKGDLVIEDNPLLGNLDALSGLRGVGGDLVLRDCPELYSSEGLAAVERVGGHVEVERLASLREIDLLRLRWIGGALRIRDNPELRSLRGLISLESVDEVENGVEIERNQSLPPDEVARFKRRVATHAPPGTTSAPGPGPSNPMPSPGFP